MDTAKIFMNGRSQAVRLPKEFQFNTGEVCISKVGNVVMLYPQDKGWEILAQSLEHFSDDFMQSRDQPVASDKRPAL